MKAILILKDFRQKILYLEKRPKFTQICIFYWNGRILVEKFHDKSEGRIAYRCPGGGLKYGESLKKGLRRVIIESLGQGITEIQALGLANGVFYWEGVLKHRLYMVYDAVFINPKFYQEEAFEIEVDGEKMEFEWKNIDFFKNGKFLYPQGLYEFLAQTQEDGGVSHWLIES